MSTPTSTPTSTTTTPAGAAGATPGQPNLLYTEVEQDLRASLRELLTDRCSAAGVIARLDGDAPHDPDLWRALAVDLGLAGLIVPEDTGGAGGSAREAAVVLEELGRFVAPVPYLSSGVTATTALLACEPAQHLARVASGEVVAVLAVPATRTSTDPFPGAVRLDGERLTGRVTGIADAEVAGLLLVPATREGRPALVALPAGSEGVTLSPRTSLDTTRRGADLDLAVQDSVVEVLATGEAAETAVSAALSAAAGLLASEQLGLAEWCLATTVDYVKQRRQFARPVGSFQALKHRLADLWAAIEQARTAARYAADCLSGDSPDTPVAVAMAQSMCAEVAVRAAEECIQLHGGIGMTWEHPAHVYLKRARADLVALGTPGRHRADLAHLIDLPPPT
jgi:alkylation response protein AidB-like acyl-CoA dehydrogenase